MFVWLSETLDRAESTFVVYSSFIISLLLALALVFFNSKNFGIISILVSIIIAALIFLLITSTKGDNLAGSLPSTTYPIPPHLGLDGISLENRYPY